MSIARNLLAGIAGVVAYKLVDTALRKIQREVLHDDVEELPPIPNAEKDAIVVVGSRLDRIPTVRERDAIARSLNFAGSLVATTLALEVREHFFDTAEDEGANLTRNLLLSLGTFAAVELAVKPLFGWGEASGRQRRFISHMAARATQHAVLKAFD